MYEQINRLAENMLLEGERVTFPKLGTLYVEQTGARRGVNSELFAPSRELRFRREEDGVSIISSLASASGMDEARCCEVYDSWLNEALMEDGVCISGLGTLTQRKFVPDAQFARLLDANDYTVTLQPAPKLASLRPANAAGKPRRAAVKRGSSKGILGWIAAALILVVLCGGMYIYSANQWYGITGTDDLVALFGGKPAQQETVDKTLEMPVQVADTLSIEDQTAVPVEQQEVSEVSDVEQTSQEEILNMEPGMIYAVYGVYSERDNATYYRGYLREKNPELRCDVYYWGVKYMLTVACSATESEHEQALQRIHAMGGSFSEVWTYRKKQQ